VVFFAKRSPQAGKAVIKDSPRVVELDRERAPEKIVIVSAHPFGAALKYLLLGAAAGAAATFFLLKNRMAPASARGAGSGKDAVAEGLSAGGAKSERALLGRISSLASRLKGVAGAVRGLSEFAGDTIGPAVSAAVSEGKRTAREVEAELKQDLEESKREAEAEAKEAKPEAGSERDKKHDDH